MQRPLTAALGPVLTEACLQLRVQVTRALLMLELVLGTHPTRETPKEACLPSPEPPHCHPPWEAGLPLRGDSSVAGMDFFK